MNKTIKILIPIVLFLAAFAGAFLIARFSRPVDVQSSEGSQSAESSAAAEEESGAQTSGEQAAEEENQSGSEQQSSAEDAEPKDSSDDDNPSEGEGSGEEDSTDSQDSPSEESAASGEDSTSEESSETDPESREESTAERSGEEPDLPAELQRVLEKSGETPGMLDLLGCRQLIVTESSGTTAQISMYTRSESDGIWHDTGLTTPGYVGSNGVTNTPSEGYSASPAGLYPIGEAFYKYDKPATGLNSFQITEDTYWVDDPNSPHYNQKVIGTAEKDWNSAEEMYAIEVYKYGFVINYNTSPVVPGMGSAIFFHISYGPTAGCIGTSESMVLAYLAELDASQNPFILIL